MMSTAMLNDFKNDDTNISSEKLLEGKIKKEERTGWLTCTYLQDFLQREHLYLYSGTRTSLVVYVFLMLMDVIKRTAIAGSSNT